jgi:hypothetical protein
VTDQSNERNLWCAVLSAALEDAIKQPTDREWFLKPNRDFDLVCVLAGREPDRVRKAASRAFERADTEPKQAPLASRLFEYNGRSMTLAEWAKELGFRESVLRYRIKQGWSIERTLTEPSRRTKPDTGSTPGGGSGL